jgi:hypothetical protein
MMLLISVEHGQPSAQLPHPVANVTSRPSLPSMPFFSEPSHAPAAADGLHSHDKSLRAGSSEPSHPATDMPGAPYLMPGAPDLRLFKPGKDATQAVVPSLCICKVPDEGQLVPTVAESIVTGGFPTHQAAVVGHLVQPASVDSVDH